jgi:hypothetical protein
MLIGNTDSEGWADLDALPSGPVWLRVLPPAGFAPASISIEVPPGERVELGTITLERTGA